MADSAGMCHFKWQIPVASDIGYVLQVDFVVYDDMDFLAIEVKNAAKLDSKDFSGLKSFASDYPEARTVLLYRGDVQYMHGNILVVPVGRYLCSLSPNEPFPVDSGEHLHNADIYRIVAADKFVYCVVG